MIHNPFQLILVLLAVEFSILFLAGNPRSKGLFKFLPSMFWIYFLPMVLSTCGIIDAKSPLYQGITRCLLPPALFLLLLNVDIKAISRLGPSALVMFFAGSLGIMLGMVISFVIFKPLIGPQFWAGFGALSASWTGGSANMVAVKEALNTPDSVFLPMVIVDTIVPYVWMGILVTLAARQKDFDCWNLSDRRILDDLAQSSKSFSQQKKLPIHPAMTILIIGLALGVGRACQAASAYLPTGKDALSPYAWTIILVSASAIILSTTPISRLPDTGAEKFGKWILYFVLTSIGARASLNNASQVGVLIAAGVVVIFVHAVILIVTARLIRAPLFLVATASLANIAGLVSAPVVAELYQPGLASVGLLLAILGHSIGAYNGIITGQICRLFIH
ncbi:MAG: DUF819 family protein [Candidatus Omnitrophica bacterium]|nr:DUF819 family protein [Candidatus Omnitrophota bacterium]